MADSTLNAFVASGTAAERAAFTPTPPTPSSGPDSGYFFFETDTGLTYSWDGAVWVLTGGSPNAVTAAGTLTANRIVLGAGTKTVAELGSLGTTTTLLHGNAAGAPTFGAVTLTTDVTGVLPVANGGTGSASGSAELKATVTVTNAQWIGLPTAGKLLVAAPGAGFYISWSRIDIKTFFTTAAYTGMAAVSSIVASATTGENFSTPIQNDNTTTPALTQLTRLHGAASRRARLVPYLESIGDDGAEEYILTGTADGTVGIDSLAALDNASLSLFGNNGGVDFTGGNVANSAKVTVYYTIEPTT